MKNNVNRLLSMILALLLALIPAVLWSGVNAADGQHIKDTQYFDFHTSDQAAFLADTLTSVKEYTDSYKGASNPMPVTLDFSGDGLETVSSYVVQKSNTPDFEQYETLFGRTSGKKYELYNTKLGEHFFWRAASSEETISSSPVHEVYITSEAPRNLFVYGVGNVRDIGGWKSSLGENASIRQGLYFRGANPDAVLERGKMQLRDLGIKVEIDLRSPDHDGGFTGESYIEGIEYHNIRIGEGGRRFDDFREEYTEIFRIISEAGERPVYLHCQAGADRTGLVTLMLLTVCGVSFEDTARDYMFTSFSSYGTRDIKGDFETFYLRLGEFEGDTKAEQAANWLRSKGISDETIEKIRETFVENYDPEYSPESELKPSSWAENEVQLALDAGLLTLELRSGYKKPITRGAVSGMLVNLIEKASGKSIDRILTEKGIYVPDESMFSDTKDKNVIYAYALGIIKGVGNDEFKPQGTLTRAQIAALICRVANLLGVETEGYTHTFEDITGNNKWVDSELGWPSSVGIIKGVSSSRFNPGGDLTKEQAILIAYRALEVLQTEKSMSRLDETGYETPEKDSGKYLTDFVNEDSVIAYITFDTLGDKSDLGNLPLSYNGDVLGTYGYFGNSADISKGYISLGNGFDPSNSSFSVSLWINKDELSDEDPAVISNKDWDSGDNPGFIFSLRKDDIKFNLGDGENRMDEVWYLPSNFCDGWVHLLLIVDRENGKVGVGFDFAEPEMRDIPGELKSISFTTEYSVNIGQDGTGTYEDGLDALVDEIVIFGNVLGTDDISALKAYYKAVE